MVQNGPKFDHQKSRLSAENCDFLIQGGLLAPPKSANFEKIDVLDVLDVTNPQKSMTKCRLASTRAPETFRNPAFQHFRVLSEEPPGPGHQLKFAEKSFEKWAPDEPQRCREVW